MRRLASLAVGVLLLLGAAVFFHDGLIETVLLGFARAAGYDASVERLHVGWGDASVRELIVKRQGAPVVSVRRVGVRFLGERTLTLDAPTITLIHRADGSYNVPLFSNASSTSPARLPSFGFRVRVRDGEIRIIDRYAQPRRERRLVVERVRFDAAYVPRERSWYDAAFAFDDGHGVWPGWGRGLLSPRDAWVSQHWHAAALPLTALVNFTLRSRDAFFTGGELAAPDVRWDAPFGAGGIGDGVFSGTARLAEVAIRSSALAVPIRDLRGSLRLFDGVVTTPGLDGNLGATRLHLFGGVYDPNAPSLRMVARDEGDLRDARALIDSLRARPVAGRFVVETAIEGSSQRPLVLARFSAPRVDYDGTIFSAPRSLLAVLSSGSAQRVDVIDANAAYVGSGAALAATLRGSLTPGTRRAETLEASMGATLPALPLRVAAVAEGVNERLATSGVVSGDGAFGALRGSFALDASGDGLVGPLVLRRGDGGAAGGEALLDGGDTAIAAALDASRLRLPNVNGAIDARASVLTRGEQVLAANATAQLRDARGVVARAHASAASTRGGAFAVTGRARGSLDALRTAASGDIDARFVAWTHPGDSRAVGGWMGLNVARGGFAGMPIGGNASLAYDAGRLTIDQALLSIAHAYGAVSGSATTRRLDLRASAPAIDVANVARDARVRLPYPVTGSLAARMRITGSPNAPSVAGKLGMSVGSVNGLVFHDASMNVTGTPNALFVRDGGILVGETHATFAASAVGGHRSFRLRSSDLDLDDFDDFFDQGDMLQGHGALQLTVASGAGAPRVWADTHLIGLGVRDFSLGRAALGLRPQGDAELAEASIVSANGNFFARTVADVPHRRVIAANARVEGLNLDTWLPAAGIVAPVVGKIDANVSGRGSAQAFTASLSGALRDGIVARVPIQRFTLDARADERHVRVTRVALAIPHLTAEGSGRLALKPTEPFNFSLSARSDDLGGLARAVNQHSDMGGTLVADARIGGTRANPDALLTTTVSSLRVNKLTVPRVFVAARVDRRNVTLDRAELDARHGRAVLSAQVPVMAIRRAATMSEVPLRAALRFDALDLGSFASFASVLPSGTKIGGVLNGEVGVSGTAAHPNLDGRVALSKASYASNLLAVPVENASAAVDFHGTSARISGLHLQMGHGTLDGDGVASVGDPRHPLRSAAFDVAMTARSLRVDAPKYLRGTVDGALSVARAPGEDAMVSGNLALNSVRVPVTALIPSSSSAGAPALPLGVAFDLAIAADRDVRVQSGNIDIGARGKVLLGGTLAAPTLDGHFTATDGTISFYRTFTLQSAGVSFSPDLGVIPMVNAIATTHVSDPDTDVLLHVTGPADQLNIAFSSDPSYDRTQIVALLAGFGPTNGPPTDQSTLLQSTAVGYVNQQFTRTLLEPLQSGIAQRLGLSSLQIDAGIGAPIGTRAAVALGKHVSGSFAQTYGPSQRRTIALRGRLANHSSVQVSAFSASGQPALLDNSLNVDPTQPNALSLITLVPPAGTSGFSLSYQHHFW